MPIHADSTGPSSPAPCLWLTGRRGAGKHTVARLVAATLQADGHGCAVLDAEVLTRHLARGPTDGGLESLAWLAGLLTTNGVVVVVAVDTPRRADRDRMRDAIPGFAEVHVDAPASTCADRCGVTDPAYEDPLAPDVRVPTHDRDAAASAAQVVSFLDGWLAAG